MRVSPGNAQHIGDREQQQDSFGFSNFGDDAFARQGGFMMVLCDGMGGLANGTAASRAAVDAVLSGYQRKQPSEDIASALERCISEAQDAVCTISGGGGSAGTTVIAAVVWNDRLYWASLGDSRLYHCHGDESARQLTTDHNVATLLDRRPDRDDLSEAARTANPEALTEYLGSPHRPQPDIERNGWPLRPGDRVVACSDGVYRGLTPTQIAAATRRANPMTAAERMIEWVLEQRLPHQDNLTAILFEVAPSPRLGWMPDLAAFGTALGDIPARRRPRTRSSSGSVGLLPAAGAGFAAGVVLTLLVGQLDLFGARQPLESSAASADSSKPASPQPGSNLGPSADSHSTDSGNSPVSPEPSRTPPPVAAPTAPIPPSRPENGTQPFDETGGHGSAENGRKSTHPSINHRPPGSSVPQAIQSQTGANSGSKESPSDGDSESPSSVTQPENGTSEPPPAGTPAQQGDDGTPAASQTPGQAEDGEKR